MKELSMEEKAKAYDEAIKKIQEIIIMDNVPVTPKEIGGYLFPKLKESEDVDFKKVISDILLVDNDEIREILDSNGILIQDVYAWLEKQCEQNTAWSEEDELHLKDAIHAAYSPDCGGDELIAWLKLLKERVQLQWKPSDEQMHALNAINVTGNISYVGQGQKLIDLYNDLRKLKE